MPPARKPLPLDDLVERYTGGMTLQRIAAVYGMSWVTIRTRLKEAGIKMRRVGFPASDEWKRFKVKYKVNKETGCWEWTACKNSDGYGHFGVPGRGPIRAHIWAYQHFVGPVPEGK